jgi:hypothetical protein
MIWTIDLLVEFLDRKNIPRASYSFYKDKDESYCIDKIGNEWLVYYSERGTRNELGWAKNEAQALNILKLYLLQEYKAI